MSLIEEVVAEIGRLLNGKNQPHEAAIAHLALAAARSAESLAYLAELDEARFGSVWRSDNYPNEAVDDAHVRWAATGALTSLDLCMAASAKLAGFYSGPVHREVSIRDYYSVSHSGTLTDRRLLVPVPWRTWLDAVVADPGYNDLLRVRNTLVHADALRIIHGTTGSLTGHGLRFGYKLGPLAPSIQTGSQTTLMARQVVELSRDVAKAHVGAFVQVLRALP
jgi:hypothetical protein